MLHIPSILDILGPAVPLALAAIAVYLAVKAAPLLAGVARQRAYEDAGAAESVRLTIEPPAGLDPDPALAVELVRGLHPRQRRGVDGWRVGWPPLELRVVWRDRRLAWEIVGGRGRAG
jgi:hypothetical protein